MINVLVTGSNGQLASCIKDRAKQYKGITFYLYRLSRARYL